MIPISISPSLSLSLPLCLPLALSTFFYLSTSSSLLPPACLSVCLLFSAFSQINWQSRTAVDTNVSLSASAFVSASVAVAVAVAVSLYLLPHLRRNYIALRRMPHHVHNRHLWNCHCLAYLVTKRFNLPRVTLLLLSRLLSVVCCRLFVVVAAVIATVVVAVFGFFMSQNNLCVWLFSRLVCKVRQELMRAAKWKWKLRRNATRIRDWEPTDTQAYNHYRSRGVRQESRVAWKSNSFVAICCELISGNPIFDLFKISWKILSRSHKN